MPFAAGEKLGPYEILGHIGSGGMGDVYRARDSRLNRIVAIKQTKGPHSQRFEQEARAVAALNHPHICQIYDVGPDYLVMEFVEGTPLQGPLPAPTALKLAREIAAAVEEAHARRLLHRDLKPANILVTSKGSVKLLDFGLAKPTSAVADADTMTRLGNGLGGPGTEAGIIVGTAAYMSPEQAQGEPLDQRSDVFSFGVVLYEMLSGSRAFAGTSTLEILTAVLRDDPPALAGSGELGAIAERCMKKRPAERFASMADVRAALDRIGAAKTPEAAEASIAVLPFANMSRDPDDEFLSDGLAEEIINLLANVPGLKVTARTSAFAFRGKQQDIRTIANVLGVRAVLEGSVRRQGSRIRVTAQLINAADGYHLWSERYDRQMEDIFAVQDDIAAAITDALKVKLSLSQAPPQRYQPNLHAYEAVLRGWHAYWQFTPEAIARSGAFFEEAMRLDPRFAQACSGYASHLFAKVIFGFQSAHTAMPRMRELAGQALVLDPTLAEAYAMAAIVACQYEYDYAESERLFRQALACHTVPPLVRMWYGFWLLRVTGPTAEGLELQRQAIQEDPLNYILPFMYGITLTIAGRAEEGEEALRQATALQPGFVLHVELALNLVAQGKVSDALRSSESAIALAPWSAYALGTLAGVTALAGDRARSDDALRRLAESQALDTAFGYTVAHVMRGELEAAAEWASRTIDQRLPWIAVLLYPFAAPLHESRWWPDLRRKLKLP